MTIVIRLHVVKSHSRHLLLTLLLLVVTAAITVGSMAAEKYQVRELGHPLSIPDLVRILSLPALLGLTTLF